MARTATIGGWIGILAVALPVSQALAVDGWVVSAHYEKPGFSNIHDSVTPGKLMRYDIKNDQVTGSRELYARDGVEAICISPFGDRVAFTKPNGMIAVVSADGGPETEIINACGTEKPGENSYSGLQWPASEGGRWIYYSDARNGGQNNSLRRVNVETKQDELVVHFNRSAGGSFALSMDATPHSGKYVKRTDNYVIAIYDMARGDGDLYNCSRTFGCGESISPDGSLLTANTGWHTGVSLVDMTGQGQHDFRLSQWEGDPCNPALGKTREQTEWAWQGFRWGIDSMGWVAVTQGKLKLGSSYETYFEDAMLYDWVNKKQINVTKNPVGKFDRAGGFWETTGHEQFLGYYGGKAPLTVEWKDSRLVKPLRWDFGDGSAQATGQTTRHTFQKEGVYTVRASGGASQFKAQVTVQKRRQPHAAAHYLDPQHLLVDFDEPVVANNAGARLASGAKAEKLELNETGRRMVVSLLEPLKKSDRLRLDGIQDTAQVPNALPDAPLPVAPPAWPSNRSDLVFLWEDGKSLNAVYNKAAGSVKELRVSHDAGDAGLDRLGRMRLDGGRLSTGFFSQANAQMDLKDLVLANAFSLEATVQPANLTQKKLKFPARIINCSSWEDGDWEFMLGQQEDRLLFSIRTTENMLSLDGMKVAADLQGRAPVYEIAKLPDTAPHHVVVSYLPGRLVAYVDGKKSFESSEIKGSLMAFGYGELCFGDNHNGGRHGWLGRLEGVALYKRFMEADEVRTNFAAYTRKLQSRKVMPQIEVEATLRATSTLPTPKSIAPYVDALVMNEYEVTRVAGASKDWKFKDKIQPGARIRVAQWSLIGARPTALAAAKAGDSRRLVLEVYEGHPDKLDQIVTSNSLDLAQDLPQLYEPGDHAPAGRE